MLVLLGDIHSLCAVVLAVVCPPESVAVHADGKDSRIECRVPSDSDAGFLPKASKAPRACCEG